MDAFLRLVLTNAALSGLIALTAWGASRVVRRQAVVHALWLLALVKLVTPPLVGLPLFPSPAAAQVPPERAAALKEGPGAKAAPTSARPPAPAEARLARTAREAVTTRDAARLPAVEGTAPVAGPRAASSDAIPTTARPSGPAFASVTRVLLPALLALGAFAVAGLSVFRFLRFRRLLAAAEPAPDAVARRAAALARSLGMRRVPPVRLLPSRVPPMLWPSTAGPLLLLPRDLLPGLDAEELDALLAHELAHVRRRDHWVRFLEIGTTALFWWYPVTWWARRALRRAEERCCDEWVLRALPSSARAYASGILKSLEFLSGSLVPVPSAASGAGPIDDLESRLKEILMTYPLPRLSRPIRLVLAGGAIAALALSPTVAPTRAAQAAAVMVPADTDETLAPAKAPRAPAPGAPGSARAPVAPPAPPDTPSPALAPRAPVAVGLRLRTPLPYLVAGGTPIAFHEEGEIDPALAAERRALDEQRRQLELSELDLQRKSIDLESKVRRKETSAEAARLRSEGDADGAARVEKRGALADRRVDLERRHLDLQVQETKLASEMERAVAAAERQGGGVEAVRAAEKAEKELEAKSQALEAETEKLDRELQALDAEMRVHELRGATEDLADSLEQQVASLREALPESGAQKAELEKEIQRLEAALTALRGGVSKGKSPAPAKTAAR